MTPQPQTTIPFISMDPQYVGESLSRGLDFTPQLSASGDTFIGSPTVTATCINGVDSGNPLALIVGTPGLSTGNTQIIARISGGVSGAAYQLVFACSTQQGNTLEGKGVLYTV